MKVVKDALPPATNKVCSAPPSPDTPLTLNRPAAGPTRTPAGQQQRRAQSTALVMWRHNAAALRAHPACATAVDHCFSSGGAQRLPQNHRAWFLSQLLASAHTGGVPQRGRTRRPRGPKGVLPLQLSHCRAPSGVAQRQAAQGPLRSAQAAPALSRQLQCPAHVHTPSPDNLR
jgi:hypothetical protein